MPFMLRDNGFQRPVFSPEPNYQAGNAEFLDPDPACRIQIRPLLKSDYAGWGEGRPGNAVLCARESDSEHEFICFIWMPRQLRKNNRASVMAAIKLMQILDPTTAGKLRAIAAQTKWPRP
jgi:hypothetical protein